VSAALELAAVQGLELGAELLVFPFQFTIAALLLVELLIELLDNVLVVALGAGDVLIAAPYHVRRQALQIGATIPVGTNEPLIQFGKSRHGL
jgi:hypothetical protein